MRKNITTYLEGSETIFNEFRDTIITSNMLVLHKEVNLWDKNNYEPKFSHGEPDDPNVSKVLLLMFDIDVKTCEMLNKKGITVYDRVSVRDVAVIMYIRTLISEMFGHEQEIDNESDNGTIYVK